MAQAKKTTKTTKTSTSRNKKLQEEGHAAIAKAKETTAKAKEAVAAKPSKAKAKAFGDEVDDAVTEMMEEIDGHEYAGSDVSQGQSVDFYKGIIQACQDRVQTIQHEMGEDDGPLEEVDSKDDDEDEAEDDEDE